MTSFLRIVSQKSELWGENVAIVLFKKKYIYIKWQKWASIVKQQQQIL